MKLLYVIDSLAPGGAEMSLAEMAPELIRTGLDLHVLPLGRRLDLKGRLDSAGAAIHEGPGRLTRRAFVDCVAQTISTVRPDLVHTTLYEANCAGRIASRLKRVPSSTSFVGDTYGRRPHGRAALLKLEAARMVDLTTARFASRFHAVSQHLANSVATQLRIPADRIDVIPRGRDRDRFPFRPPGVRDEVRQELGLHLEAPVVIAVGRLERVKGLEYLMDALPDLATLVPGVQLVVAGKDGAAASDVRDAATRTRVPVRFLGHRQDVGRLLAAADVLAFPSLSEGSPGTVIEAMATGCPVVASDIWPNREVLGANGHAVGVTVPVGDSSAMAQALATVLSDPVAADSMTALARKRFEAEFEIGAVSAKMAGFFKDAVSSAASDRLGCA